jgi:hypothetical protein
MPVVATEWPLTGQLQERPHAHHGKWSRNVRVITIFRFGYREFEGVEPAQSVALARLSAHLPRVTPTDMQSCERLNLLDQATILSV